MTEHIMQQDLIDNHKTELIKSIIEIYINLRLFREITDLIRSITDLIRRLY